MLEETFAVELSLKCNLSGKGAQAKKAFLQLRLYKIMFGKKH